MDYEEITIMNIMQQLQDIAHSQSAMQSDVAVIKSEQATIKCELAEHKAQTPQDKSGLVKVLDVLRSWILPIILAIFLLGRQSVEYTNQPMKQYPPNAIIGSAADDTFIASNKKFDSLLIKQIMKGVKP